MQIHIKQRKFITTIMKDRLVREKKQFKKKRDNYTRKLKRKKLINFLRRELQTCSVHGLPYIVNTQIHWFERFFWTVSFVFCLWLIYFLISILFTRYINAPLVMSVEMDYFNWNISYPAVSLCPKDKIDIEDMETLINQTLESVGVDLGDNLKALSSISLDAIETLDLSKAIASKDLIEPKDYVEVASTMFKKFNNDCLTTNTNWPISVVTALTEMGMCHVINSNVAYFDDVSKWKIPLPYVKTNIDLSVYNQDFFIQLLEYAEEYKLFIHNPDEIILATTPSYVMKGQWYRNIEVKVWSTRASKYLKGVPLSVRKCRFKDEPISERYPVYSYNHCLLECRIQMILKLCKCIPHFYKNLDRERICDLNELHCIVRFKKELITLSTSPGTWNKFINKDGLPTSPRDCGCLSDCETDVFLKDLETVTPHYENKARIAISAFPKVKIVREIIFNIVDVIIRSGGVMNLCIGTSVISLMELLMIALKIIIFKMRDIIIHKLYELGWYKPSKGTKQI